MEGIVQSEDVDDMSTKVSNISLASAKQATCRPKERRRRCTFLESITGVALEGPTSFASFLLVSEFSLIINR